MNEDMVRTAYGKPYREQAAFNSKYLYYKNAQIIFFIDGDREVKHWFVFNQKR